MKNALISTHEPVVNFDGTSGYRVAEVAAQTFEVAPTLFWVDCDDACIADQWYYDTETNTCKEKPIEVVEQVQALGE
jgi:hypothetical protein